jgi:hypothetical protein
LEADIPEDVLAALLGIKELQEVYDPDDRSDLS